MVVSSCLVWQQRNNPKQKQRHSFVDWPPSFSFVHIGFDFLGPLVVSNGNAYEASICEQIIKWYRTVVLPIQTPEMTATALLEQWISRFGDPVSIHTDEGRSVAFKPLPCLPQTLQIDKTSTTYFRLQCHAVIGRMNRCFSEHVGQNCWWLPKQLDSATSICVDGDSNFSPRVNRLHIPVSRFSEEINLPLDIRYPSPELRNKTDVHQFFQQKRVNLQRAHEAARL